MRAAVYARIDERERSRRHAALAVVLAFASGLDVAALAGSVADHRRGGCHAPPVAAVLERGEHGAVGLWFPDFPGCVAAARTQEEAMARASDDDKDKVLWLTLAQSWVRLAEHVARVAASAERGANGGEDVLAVHSAD